MTRETMVLTWVRRGCRHLFRLRWEMDLSTGHLRCPCCQGMGGHWLLDPRKKLSHLGRDWGVYQAANVVGCSYCRDGVVVASANVTWDDVHPGQCCGW